MRYTPVSVWRTHRFHSSPGAEALPGPFPDVLRQSIIDRNENAVSRSCVFFRIESSGT